MGELWASSGDRGESVPMARVCALYWAQDEKNKTKQNIEPAVRIGVRGVSAHVLRRFLSTLRKNEKYARNKQTTKKNRKNEEARRRRRKGRREQSSTKCIHTQTHTQKPRIWHTEQNEKHTAEE